MYVPGSQGCSVIDAIKIGVFCALTFLSAYAALNLGGFLTKAWAQISETDASSQISISNEACRRLIAHVPNADVAYKPGVDVRGNAVASADLPGTSLLKLPETIQFNLSFDLMSEFGVTDASPLAPIGEASIGVVTFDILSGKSTFNGQPLGDPEQSMLAAVCRRVAE
jgi:hypothetical protein